LSQSKRLESQVKDSIRNWLNKHECFHFSTGGNFMGGMPDRIVTVDRGTEYNVGFPSQYNRNAHLVIGLEAKRYPDGKPTPKQLSKHKELRKHGWIVGVVRSVDDVKKLLAEHGVQLIKK